MSSCGKSLIRARKRARYTGQTQSPASSSLHKELDAAAARVPTSMLPVYDTAPVSIPPPSKGAGTLYMVAVPIGCLEDISLRALRILREVRLIICENRSVFRPLAEQFDIKASLISYKTLQTDRLDADWVTRLRGGENIAFVCDAGTPTLADPGLRLVRAALNHNIPVSALPGPAAVLVALAASGLSARRFVFDGFPPRDPDARIHFFQSLARQQRTTVLYETASRLCATLRAIYETCGMGRRVAVACRLTQPNETWVRGTALEVFAHFQNGCPRGEYTIIIDGQRQKTPKIMEQWTR